MKLLKFLKVIIIIILILISCESPTETDTTPPTVDIIDPLDKSTVNEIVEINCTSSDNKQVQKLVLWVDNTITTEVDETEPYSFYWNTVDYDNNSYHTIFVRSFDKSGNKTDSKSFIYKVDNSQSHPYPVNVNIDYSTEEMTVSWSQSTDGDFDYYKLYYSESEDGIKSILTTYNEKYETIYTITEFNPLIENWFWVNVVDTLGLSTMTSNKNEIDSPPTQIDITSVDYDLENMTVSWDISIEDDFISYELLQSTSEDGEYESVVTIDDISTISYSISEFDPTIDNWFKIKVTDFWGLTSIGTEVSNEIDNNPNTVDVTSVIYDLENMTINWNEYEPNLGRIQKMNNESQQTTSTPDNDFVSYELLHSTSEVGEYESVVVIDNISTTSYLISDFDPTIENWFKIRVTDFWGLTSIGYGMTNLIDSTPTKINILSIEYNLQEMVITWDESVDNDFISYKLLYSEDEDGDKELVSTYTDINSISYSTSEFTPIQENWYWIEVNDIWGLTSIGDGLTNDIDSPPTQIDITSVDYDLENMTVSWDISTDNDFISYEIIQSISEDGEYESVIIIDDVSTTSYSISEFDPTIDNWFKIKVTDFWGLTSIGIGMSNDIDSPPTQVSVTSVDYDLENMNINWETSIDSDFISYELLHSTSEVGEYESVTMIENISTTSYQISEYDPTIENWFKIRVTDNWGLTSIGYGMTNLIDSTPTKINISSIEYDFEEMTINWEESPDNDFISYEIIQSISEDGEYESVIIIDDVSTTSYSISEFDPTIDNWFKIKVTDFWGLTSIGIGMSNDIDSPPSEVELNPIIYENGSFTITWSQNLDQDFESYTLYESNLEDMSNGVEIYSSNNNLSFLVENINEGEYRYYQLVVNDLWGLNTNSNIRVGDTWIKFVKTFSGSSSPKDVIQTSDGGYIILSSSFLLKTNSNGIEEWRNNSLFGVSVIQTNDGGYVILGGLDSDIKLIKTDSFGSQEWINYFSGDLSLNGNQVIETLDGSLVIVGSERTTVGNLHYGIYVLKTNILGEEIGSQLYDICCNYFHSIDMEGYSISQTEDEGFIITGYVENFHGNNNWDYNDEIRLLKLTSNFSEQWSKTINNNSGSPSTRGKYVQQINGGSIIISRNYYSGDLDSGSLIKTDENGNVQWTNNEIYGNCIQQTNDGGFIIISEYFIIKTDSNGIEEWKRSDNNLSRYSVRQTNDNGFVFTGYSEGNMLLIKTNPLGNWE